MTHTRIYYQVQGGHVHARFFSGKRKNTTHGKNGDLIFTVEEWQTILSVLAAHGDIFELIEEPQT